MSSLRVLFLGGTGIISSACSWRAIESGLDLTIVNRGKTAGRPVPPEARVITADLDDPATLTQIAAQDFDVVVDWIAFTPDHVRARTDALRGHVGQYVFISSASAYQTPPAGCRSPSRRHCGTPSGSTRATRSPARTCSPRSTATRATR